MGEGGNNLMLKPGDFGHCRGDALRKCHHLDLQVDGEGFWTSPTDDLDGTVGDVGLVERHATLQAKWVGANLVRVEPQALDADIGGMEAEA